MHIRKYRTFCMSRQHQNGFLKFFGGVVDHLVSHEIHFKLGNLTNLKTAEIYKDIAKKLKGNGLKCELMLNTF